MVEFTAGISIIIFQKEMTYYFVSASTEKASSHSSESDLTYGKKLK